MHSRFFGPLKGIWGIRRGSMWIRQITDCSDEDGVLALVIALEVLELLND